MNKFMTGLKNVVRAGVNFVDRCKTKLAVGLGLAGAAVCTASAQTDATVIATNASDAFAVIAPITITIAGFYVILRIAKRVVS